MEFAFFTVIETEMKFSPSQCDPYQRQHVGSTHPSCSFTVTLQSGYAVGKVNHSAMGCIHWTKSRYSRGGGGEREIWLLKILEAAGLGSCPFPLSPEEGEGLLPSAFRDLQAACLRRHCRAGPQQGMVLPPAMGTVLKQRAQATWGRPH